jgi:hypothetical protein
MGLALTFVAITVLAVVGRAWHISRRRTPLTREEVYYRQGGTEGVTTRAHRNGSTIAKVSEPHYMGRGYVTYHPYRGQTTGPR